MTPENKNHQKKNQNKKQPSEEENVFEAIAKDRFLRRQLGRRSHQMFFTMYFPHYIQHPMAEFHKDIFRITEDLSNNLACIVAFRGSGKSTLITFSYSLWAILGVQQKKFVLIICQTQAQARQHMANLKHELENNVLLKSDMGPFKEENGVGDWAISSLVFDNTGARIMIASIDQSIRGIRHREHRPDLIILDDIEDGNLVRTLESRNKIAEWFYREVIPLGDIGTRIILCGNLLHEDSLMMRLKKKVDDKEIKGIYKWFPLLDENGTCLWPGKFNTPEKIKELRQGVISETAWQQEYLLRIVSDASRVIFPEWIHYYDGNIKPIMAEKSKFPKMYAAVDLAISEKETADCTAIIQALVSGYGKNIKIYILPNPVNKRMAFPETIEHLKATISTLGSGGKLFVETVGFQEAYLQQLLKDGCSKVEGVKALTDKRSRLALTASLIQEGKILFPQKGCKELLAQILNFGLERHDDLADAFSILIQKIMEIEEKNQGFYVWMEFIEENGGMLI
ncbi:hypothetical protein C4572_00110 [Candidatus Parcubacteria bacterium]|nr:MAG: hypothetical protein C4572_00110 [Candidatus Parcubacteria bacterium]